MEHRELRRAGSPRSEFEFIAEVLSWFDVVAVQEVRENFSHLEQVHSRLPAPYRLLFTDIAGNQERMTFVYDASKVTLLEKIGEISIPPADLPNIKLPGITQMFRGFDRNPYLRRSGRPDKLLFVNVHLYFGSDQSEDICSGARSRRSPSRGGPINAARASTRSRRKSSRSAISTCRKPRQAIRSTTRSSHSGLELPDHSGVIGSSIVNDAQYDEVAFFPGERPRVHGQQGRLRLRHRHLPGLVAVTRQVGFRRLPALLHVGPSSDVGGVQRHVVAKMLRGRAVHEPGQLALVRRTAARKGRRADLEHAREDRRLLRAAHEKCHATCGVDQRQRQRQPRRRIAGTSLATTSRSRSASAAVPGNSDAVCPSAPRPSSTRSKRGISRRARRTRPAGHARTRSPPASASEFAFETVDARRIDRHVHEERLQGHPEIAVGIVRRHAPLVAPPPVDLAPRHPESRVSRPRRGARTRPAGSIRPTARPNTCRDRATDAIAESMNSRPPRRRTRRRRGRRGRAAITRPPSVGCGVRHSRNPPMNACSLPPRRTPGGQRLEQLRVAAAEDEVVDLERGLQPRHDDRRPHGATSSCRGARGRAGRRSPRRSALLVGQVRQFHRLDHAVDDRARSRGRCRGRGTASGRRGSCRAPAWRRR